MAEKTDDDEDVAMQSKKPRFWQWLYNKVTTMIGNERLDKGLLKPYASYARAGIAIIINNVDFVIGKRPNNPENNGAEKDADVLKSFWSNHDFEVIEEKNLSGSVLKDKLEEVSKRDGLEEVSCFVCCILSYGEEGCVYGTGGAGDSLELDDIIQPFKGNKCQSLKNKPKLFFIQTCNILEPEEPGGPQIDSESDAANKIPVEADLLLVQSCISGYRQWHQDADKPSWFINALLSALWDAISANSTANNEYEVEFLSIVSKMNGKLWEKIQNNEGIKLPYSSSTLRKSVKFKVRKGFKDEFGTCLC